MISKFRKIQCSALIATAAALASTSVYAEPPFKSGEVVVKGAPHLYSSEFTVKRHLPLSNLTILEVGKGDEKAAINKLRKKGRWARLNLLVSKFVDDSYRSYQWNLDAIQADSAWGISTGDAGTADNPQPVKVAVLDTGLAVAPAGGDGVTQCSTGQWDFVNDDADPDDGDGHGTHVSGTISQMTDNGVGVAGLAYGACVMPVKVLDDNGSGTDAVLTEGILHAVQEGAQVINMSLGWHARYGYINFDALNAAMQYAEDQGVLIVAAAGNDGWRKNVSYPALHSAVMAVGATDFRNQKAPYSNYGTGLDIMAPGGDTGRDDNGDGYADGILQETRLDADGDGLSNDWGYYFFQGTSMASPHVAALAALVIANEGSVLTPSEVRDRITSSALALGSTSRYGAGLIQAADALGGSTPPPVSTNNAPVAAFSYSCADRLCSFDGSNSSDQDNDPLTFSWNFGDGVVDNESGSTAVHEFASDGTYTVSLTVFDPETSDTAETTFSVSGPAVPGAISLDALGYKRKGVQHVSLSWDGNNDNVDVYWDGTEIDSDVPGSSGDYSLDRKGGGNYLFKVCDTGTDNCSSDVPVVF
ncbi:MAG: S8 family serine peptidase [Neptuniibacter sp.]